MKPIGSFRLFVSFFLTSLGISLAWHTEATAFLIFFAFVPVFYLVAFPPENHNERLGAGILTFLGMFCWVYLSLYWIRPVSPVSHLSIAFLSAIVFSIPFLAAYISRRRGIGFHGSAWVFISLWLLIETLHDLNILGLPYLNFGHILGAYPRLIQWYSWVGSAGGTVWIFAVNYALASVILHVAEGRSFRIGKPLAAGAISVVVLPVLVSLWMLGRPLAEKESGMDVVAVHTAVNVRDYKYRVDPEVLINEYVSLTKPVLHDTSAVIVFWPENALTEDLYYTSLDSSLAVKQLRQKLLDRDDIYLVTGAIVDEIVDPPGQKEYAPNLHYSDDGDYFFKHYNAAIFLGSDRAVEIKTKKRLVPFSEKVPTARVLAPLVRILPNLAELKFSSRDDGFPAFALDSQVVTSPVICYGSAFSSFCARQTRQTGSTYLSVILNAGWMKSEKAFMHFDWFSVCRAIENRQFLVKSSNEGSSGMIDSRGFATEYISGYAPGTVRTPLLVTGKRSLYTVIQPLVTAFLLLMGVVLFPLILWRNRAQKNTSIQ